MHQTKLRLWILGSTIWLGAAIFILISHFEFKARSGESVAGSLASFLEVLKLPGIPLIIGPPLIAFGCIKIGTWLIAVLSDKGELS